MKKVTFKKWIDGLCKIAATQETRTPDFTQPFWKNSWKLGLTAQEAWSSYFGPGGEAWKGVYADEQ